MKKVKFLALLCAPFILTACGEKNPDPVNPSQSYEKVKNCLSKQYSGFSLIIETTKGELKLTDTYTFSLNGNNYSVEYSIEKYNELSLEENVDRKTTTDGTKEIEKTNVKFDKFVPSEETFSDINYDEESGKLEYNVKNPKTFLGLESSPSSMGVKVRFNTALTSISYSYSINGCNVSVQYFDFTI